MARLAKQGWRILNHLKSLIAQVLKGLYFSNCFFMEARKGSLPSWRWCSILWERQVLENGVRWKINNGISIMCKVDNCPSLNHLKGKITMVIQFFGLTSYWMRIDMFGTLGSLKQIFMKMISSIL